MDEDEMLVTAFGLLYLVLMVMLVGVAGAFVFILYEVLHFESLAVVFFLVVVLVVVLEVLSLEKVR
jgi:predicted membrane channel-forming protein YqfA (hemolysin III family)